jgi:hypothetical protein
MNHHTDNDEEAAVYIDENEGIYANDDQEHAPSQRNGLRPRIPSDSLLHDQHQTHANPLVAKSETL